MLRFELEGWDGGGVRWEGWDGGGVGWEGAPEEGDICIHIADSHCLVYIRN